MKKLYLLLLLSVIYDWNVNAQSPAWQWAQSAGGTKQENGNQIATDANGNVLVTGCFQSDSIIFGTTTLTNTDTSSNDIFIVKYDPSGNVLWAKSSGGNKNDYGVDITVDGTGNVVVTGTFSSPAISFGTTTLINTSADTTDIFVVKYDPSGNVLWAKSAGGSSNDGVRGISTDAIGNIFVTGYFACPTAIFGTDTLTNSSSNIDDIFIVKYDDSGNVLWAKSSGGTSFDYGMTNATDAGGNVIVTGYFVSDSITFGAITLFNSSAGTPDIFIVKYDASGNVIWAKSAGGNSSDLGYGITTDGSGNVIVTGFLGSDSITFGTTVLINADPGNADIYIVKYDSSGNALWAKSAGGDGLDIGIDVATDGNDNVLATGSYESDSIIFGTTTLVNSTSNSLDVYFVKYDASGNFLWAKSAGGNSYDQAFGICTDVNGNVLVVGEFASDSIAFGNDQLINAGIQGSNDLFIAKLDSAVVNGIAIENTAKNAVNVFPNPSNGQFRIASSENMAEIKITNLTGQIIYQSKPKEKIISLKLDEAGIYFIRVTMKDQIVTKKIMVSR